MKKIGYILLLLLFPLNTYAKSLQLEELTILNGELSLPFDALNNEYTVLLDKNEYSIEFDYKVKEDITVSVINNYDLENNATVTIFLSEGEETSEYHLHILKEEEQTIPTFHEETINTNETFMYQYKMYVIPTVCLLFIFISYKILFKKHKKKII